jgi:hypothetical protein
VPDYLPKFTGGLSHPTRTAGAGGVTGGQIVTAAGLPAGAGALDWVGIASQDAAAGQLFVAYSGAVQYPTAAGPIAQGARVKCAAGGQVTTWVSGTDVPDALVGTALEAASGAGVQFPVKFTR